MTKFTFLVGEVTEKTIFIALKPPEVSGAKKQAAGEHQGTPGRIHQV